VPGNPVGVGLGAESDRVHDLGGAGQAVVRLVDGGRVRKQPGDGERMGRLHQECPRAAEGDGALAMDAAQHRVVGEVAVGHGLDVTCEG
jgi:hypothetical protein